jgi:Ca-activated chloride channel family protein
VQVATLEFSYVALPELVMHTTTLPVHVNVVPGDQAAGRVPDPKVRSEALFQRTQRDKRKRAGC